MSGRFTLTGSGSAVAITSFPVKDYGFRECGWIGVLLRAIAYNHYLSRRHRN